MVCKSCEERREWMRVQYERAKERTAQKIANLRGLASKVIGAERSSDSTEHNADSAGRKEGSDNLSSTGTEQRTPIAAKRTGRGKTTVENVGLDNETTNTQAAATGTENSKAE